MRLSVVVTPFIVALAFAGQAGAAVFELASVSSDGVQGNAASGGPLAMTPDARFVVFPSAASNLVANDGNGTETDIFVRDRESGTTDLVSVSSAGTAANAASRSPAISADGRFVAFLSDASNLVPDDANGVQDIFLFDRATQTIERVTPDVAGDPADDDHSAPSLSSDGRYVVFATELRLSPSDEFLDTPDVYVLDRSDGTYELVSVAQDGTSASGSGTSPSVSANGRFVVFRATGSNVVAGDTNGVSDIVLRDRALGTTELVSVDSAGGFANGQSVGGFVSADGSVVVFSSLADDLVPGGGGDGQLHLYARDRATATTEQLDLGPTGAQGNLGLAGPVAVSADGSAVAFSSHSTNLVADDTNGVADVFLRDRAADATTRESLGAAGEEPNAATFFHAINGPGCVLAFATSASNLTASDTTPSTSDVFVREFRTCPADEADSTPPTIVGEPAFSVNPKAITEETVLTAVASDDRGVAGGEYFLGVDPGEGSATAMTLSGETLSATIGTSISPGVYSVGVRARDEAGNWSAVAVVYLVVYDPEGGYATGGGWIVPGGASSDPGDVLPGLDGGSKAHFGFVVKYKSGSSTVPGGQLEFHYAVGGLRLASAEYEWLVVTNTNWARFQGTGRIDGSEELYPFRVDARDGDGGGGSLPDRFVIKIYAPGSDPDVDEPLYKASGDVEGGQVKIHK